MKYFLIMCALGLLCSCSSINGSHQQNAGTMGQSNPGPGYAPASNPSAAETASKMIAY